MATIGKAQRSCYNFGQLVLNEKNERYVLQGRLTVRVRHLSSLVERLHEAADMEGRPIDVRLICYFVERCKATLSSLASQDK